MKLSTFTAVAGTLMCLATAGLALSNHLGEQALQQHLADPANTPLDDVVLRTVPQHHADGGLGLVRALAELASG